MSTIGNLTAVTLVLFLGVLAVGASVPTTAQPSTVQNESLTVDYTTPTPVDEQQVTEYFDNETVYNATDAELAAGTDYEFNTSTGEVEWFNTSATAKGEAAAITYTYTRPSDRTLGISTTLGYVARGLIVLVLLGGVAYVIDEWGTY